MKISESFLIVVLLSLCLNVNAQVTANSKYNINEDTNINVADVSKLAEILRGNITCTKGDVDGDSIVGLNDVTTLVDFILDRQESNGHKYVDMELTSGTLWAIENLGANSPENYGDYYAWGETEPKSNFTWANYSLCDGTYRTLNCYNDDPNAGVVDNLSVLRPQDDAAQKQWGGRWQVPSQAMIQELKNQCKWTLDNNRGGYTVTSKVNSKSIFLPLGGFVSGTTKSLVGNTGYYWSSLKDGSPQTAYVLVCEQSSFELNALRYAGRNIRAVIK